MCEVTLQLLFFVSLPSAPIRQVSDMYVRTLIMCAHWVSEMYAQGGIRGLCGGAPPKKNKTHLTDIWTLPKCRLGDFWWGHVR